MHELIQPNEWVAIKFPSEQTRVLQVIPNTTIALGKYGTFPANLLIERPFHVTYEVQDRCDGEAFSRLRIVPAVEIHADSIAETIVSNTTPPDAASDDSTPAPSMAETDLAALISTADPSVDAGALNENGTSSPQTQTMTQNMTQTMTQTMTLEMIEALKRHGATDAGRDLVAKLLSSHTALDRKTAHSLAKYRLLKVKKYLRRFTVLPLHPTTLATWFLDEREATRVLDMREEMLALVGCWANAHFSELPVENRNLGPDSATSGKGDGECVDEGAGAGAGADAEPMGGRWLVIDDTGGLLVAAVAERMGILYPEPVDHNGSAPREDDDDAAAGDEADPEDARTKSLETDAMDVDEPDVAAAAAAAASSQTEQQPQEASRADLAQRYRTKPIVNPNCAPTNTITVIHANSQPSMHALRYYGFDVSSPPTRPPFHPLATNLFTLSWLQLLEPETDPIYGSQPDDAAPDEIASWKASRKSTYFRKLRRWRRVSHVIDSTRAGGFSGVAIASTMDPASILQHVMPLLAPGAPVAIYTQTIEPLAQLADYFSTARRTEWASNPPVEAADKTAEELERWPGSADFPVNPTLLLGVGVQSSRARRWQVLPGRTHPLMTGRGGSEGYVFTAWRAVPAVGKVQARGKYKRRKQDACAG